MSKVITEEVADYKVRSWEDWFAVRIGQNNFNRAYLAWKEPWRHYHDIRHLADVLEKISDWTTEPGSAVDEFFVRDLFVVALFHDIIYLPSKLYETVDGIGHNEYMSAENAETVLKGCSQFNEQSIARIKQAILDTYKRTEPEDEFSRTFWKIDNSILDESFGVLLDYENRVFKEFQAAPYEAYKAGRLHFLMGEAEKRNNPSLFQLIEYVDQRRPRIGIYPGSFNPFHKGHLNILRKAEKLFDKVIIVYGVNPEKPASSPDVPKLLQNHEILVYKGLIPALMKDLSAHADISLVRGLRNGKDLDYEVNQLRFMERMYPGISVVYIQCDKDWEHISSSAIRALSKFSEDAAKEYVCE